MQYKVAYVWGLLGRFLPQGIYLVTTIVLARFLSPDDFGAIGVLSIIFVTANTLLDAGLGGSLIKERKLSGVDCSSILFFNIFVSVVIYIVLFACSDFVEDYFSIAGLSAVLRTLSLVFPISALGIVPRAILNRNLCFKVRFYNSTIAVFISSCASIIVAIVGGGVYALVAYQLFAAFFTTLFDYITSKYKFVFAFSFMSLKRLLPFGIYTTLITVIDTIYENLLTALTGKFLNVTQAGYLYQAKRIEETMTLSLATTIGTVTFPILTKIKDDKAQFKKEATSTLKVICSLLFPLLITIAIFSKEIIVLLFGDNWLESSLYLEYLIFAGIFIIIETLFRNFIKSLCEVSKLFKATIIKRFLGILVILISLLVHPKLMLFGYILSSFIGLIINAVLYIRIIDEKVFNMAMLFVNVLLPSAIYYCLFQLDIIGNTAFWGKVVIAVISLIVIYGIILPMQGLSVASKLKFGRKC